MNKNHLMKDFSRGGGASVESSTTHSHRLTHSQAPSHKSHFFKPLIASSLALALSVSVASAQCQVVDGKPSADCTVAGADNSGMFFGKNKTQLLNNVNIKVDLMSFKWNDPTGTNILKPQNTSGTEYTNLNFGFNRGNDISGRLGFNDDYTITIGTVTNKAFLLNAGANTLKSNLSIDFTDGQDFTYYLNAKSLDGNLTLKGGGNFIANLTGGITEAIVKQITLDSATLTLSGVNNEITTFGALGGINAEDNKLIINTNVFKTTIKNLVLGAGPNTKSTLAIFSDSKFGVDILRATLDGRKTLTFNFSNQDFSSTARSIISTLKTQNTNQIRFNKNLTINRLIETTGATKDNTKLTFISKIARNTQNAHKAPYTVGHLLVDGTDDTDIKNNPKLKGTYKMAIMSNETIKPEEIVYVPNSTNNIAVATIKKHNGATSGSTDQAELRSQGVIDLGEKSDMTLQSDFSLVSFNYYVVETELYSGGSKDYITYFLDSKGSGNPSKPDPDNPSKPDPENPPKPNPSNPQRPQSVQEIILSNVALSTTGLYLANFNSLNKRMGELRDNNHSQGAWGRVFNGMQSNNIGLKSSANFVTVQAGYDYAFGLNGANNFTGFAISYGHSESKFKNEIISGNNSASFDSSVSNLVEFALYNSYVQDSGWYNDTVAKFSYLMNRIELTGRPSGETPFSNKGDINTYALTLSNEFGYRFKLGASDEWYIDPQAEMGFGYFEGQDLKFKESNSPLAKLGTMDSLLTLRGRVGASFGYDFKNFTSKENGLSAKLYLGIFGEFDYFNGGDVKFGGGIAENAIKTDARAVINVGTNLEVKDATRIYVDFESSFGGKITTNYKINAGVRYSFGENANYKSSNAVQKDNEVKEAPLKLQEEEE